MITVTAASHKTAFVLVPSNFFSFPEISFMLLHELPSFKIAVELCKTSALKMLLLCGHLFCPNLLIIYGKVFVVSFSRGHVIWGTRMGLVDLFRVPVKAANSFAKTVLDI